MQPNWIEVEFHDDREATFDSVVGVSFLTTIPRIGEHIWFSEECEGYTSWVITDVCHWVGDGKSGREFKYHRTCAYVKPTEEVEERSQQ